MGPPQPPRDHGGPSGPGLSVELLAAIAGCVFGTALPTVLGTGTGVALLGAIVGAAIRPFMTTVGPRRHLRVAAAALVTLCALGVTYTGTTFFVSPAVGEEVLPGSGAFINKESSKPRPTTAPPRGIEVTPSELVCKPDCRLPVTIKNPDPEPVVIGEINFRGADKTDFVPDERCEGERIIEGGECSFEVLFDPHDPKYDSQAELVIHHSQSDRPVVRQAISHGTGPETSGGQPDLSVGGVSCGYLPAEAVGQDGTLSIGFQVNLEGPADEVPNEIIVAAAIGDEEPVSTKASLDNGARLSLPVRGAGFDGPLEVVILVDSDDAVEEGDENDNETRVTVSPPDDPDVKQDLGCQS